MGARSLTLVSHSGRIAVDVCASDLVGGALHYYLGVAYGRTDGDGGFITGNQIFTGANPVTPGARTLTQYSKTGNALGHGFGGYVGLAWVSGPIELGVGVNDIGATITWPDTRQDSAFYRDSTVAGNGSSVIYSRPLQDHVSTKTKLPVSYIDNLAYTVRNTALGADGVKPGP